jgi:hypothetical protein
MSSVTSVRVGKLKLRLAEMVEYMYKLESNICGKAYVNYASYDANLISPLLLVCLCACVCKGRIQKRGRFVRGNLKSHLLLQVRPVNSRD